MARPQPILSAPQLTPVDLDVLIRDVVDAVGPQVAANGNRLVVRVSPGIDAPCTDQRRVRQILLNLLTNAAKYTEAGEIALNVRQDGAEIAWEVRDTGIGIPPDQLPRLFEPFAQLHEGPERRPGVGLGLALSQRLAVALGGRIEARTALQKGSTFSLRIPIRPDPVRPDQNPLYGSAASCASSSADSRS